MPLKKCPGGWKWGDSGKCYPTKAQAMRQARAIEASKTEQKKKKRKK